MATAATRRRSERALALGLALSAAGCAHAARIVSVPPGARVTIDGKPAGVAPFEHLERSGRPWREVELRAELPGRKPVVRRETVRLCDTAGNLILDSLLVGFAVGFCLPDELVLDLSN